MRKVFNQIIRQHQEIFEKSFSDSQIDILEAMTVKLIEVFKAGKKILLCGNGGSAADAQHIAAEFISRFKLERESLPALSLTTDTSIITATANDYDFSVIFSRQIEGLGQTGDVLIGISTSGNSVNVLKAIEKAKEKKMFTIGLTGLAGGKLKGVVDLCFQAQSDNTPHIQEMHITALHAVSEVVEAQMFGHEIQNTVK